jgi:hypothetical protein
MMRRKSKPKDEWVRKGSGVYESPDGRFRIVSTHDQESCRDVWQLFSADSGGGWALQGTTFPSKTAAQKAVEQPVSSD